MLSGGYLAFGTLNGGVVILDKTGNVYQILNKSAGLRDNRVFNMMRDRQGAMWLAFNNGLARVEFPSPLTLLTPASGYEGIIEAIARYRDKLYIGTHTGVYYMDGSESLVGKLQSGSGHTVLSAGLLKNPFPTFKPVDGIPYYTWYLVKAGNHLLAATPNGIYLISENRATLFESRSHFRGVRCLYQSRYDTSKVYVGLIDGLGAIQLQDGNWIDLGRFPDISEQVFNIAEDKKGNLWLGTLYQGILKVELTPRAAEESGSSASRTYRFGEEQGLPDQQVSVLSVDGRILFATQRGLRRYDPAQEKFIPDSTFGPIFADTTYYVFRAEEDHSGNWWVIGGQGTKPLNGKAERQPDGSYRFLDLPLLRLNDIIGDLYSVYAEKNRIVWLGGGEGIARYSADIPGNYTIDYPAIIRRVADISTDSIFYHGAAVSDFTPQVIAYENNSLRFEFAAQSYDDPGSNRFQFMLEGFDKRWSNWTGETRKDYTGLPPGNYLFRVRAKNIYGHLSSEGQFVFTILSPWYRSPWLYFIYVLLGGGLIFGLVKIRVRQLERKSHELEKMVSERTAQIVEQRNQLKAQSEKLQELDRLKSRFHPPDPGAGNDRQIHQ
jgi:hypothetical protein